MTTFVTHCYDDKIRESEIRAASYLLAANTSIYSTIAVTIPSHISPFSLMEMFKRYTRSASTPTEDDVEIGHQNNSGKFASRRRDVSETESLLGVSGAGAGAGGASSPASASSPLSNNMSTAVSHHHHQGASKENLLNGTSSTGTTTAGAAAAAMAPTGISRMGYIVLVSLAIQNCSKNLLMRYVMKDSPKFFTSTAVLSCECLKFTLSVLYILFIQRRSVDSILTYLKLDMRNTLLLAVPATAYNLQMKLEYVALTNLNAAIFSVLVQTKLLCTAVMAYVVLQKKLKYIQIISLTLLTVGVMLCNLSGSSSSSSNTDSTSTSSLMVMDSTTLTGVMATLGIAMSSGFASVYTEKVIKANRSTAAPSTAFDRSDYGLAYTQVQLAFMSICTIGLYALWQDLDKILEFGLFYQFSYAAWFSVLNSAIGGLIVASVLKYADSVLKGYATAMSVILTGVLSMILFNTSLSIIYFLGIINVVTAVLLYNGKDLDQLMC